MNYSKTITRTFSCSILALALSSCSSYHSRSASVYSNYNYPNYDNVALSERIPQQISTNGKKTIVVDPTVHVWGAYDQRGDLVRAGMATAGNSWCDDLNRPCRTSVGTFKIQSLGSANCKSSKYPLPKGGGLMPYCMFFHNDMALHGSPDGAVVEGNISHGCVRMRIADAEWLRNEFAEVGTKVIIKPY